MCNFLWVGVGFGISMLVANVCKFLVQIHNYGNARLRFKFSNMFCASFAYLECEEKLI